MDAVKFIREYARMCDQHIGGCRKCPLYNEPCQLNGIIPEKAEEIAAIVEKWSEENPEVEK